MTKHIQDAIPFVLGKAIHLAFIDLIRFGKKVVGFGDLQGVQPYMMIFMEVVGFKVDQVFITSFLKKHEIADLKVDSKVAEFLQDRTAFIKDRAIAGYKQSKNAQQNLEYQLNEIIGPTKLKERAKQCIN